MLDKLESSITGRLNLLNHQGIVLTIKCLSQTSKYTRFLKAMLYELGILGRIAISLVAPGFLLRH